MGTSISTSPSRKRKSAAAIGKLGAYATEMSSRLGYNVLAIPLAAGVLARQGILLSPAIGAVLMSLSTVIVAVNAQLLRRSRI